MDKLIFGNFNALTFSLAGLLIVFLGLVIIALYIAALPHLLLFLEFGFAKGKKKTILERSQLTEQEIDDETVLAIMIAFRLHNLSGYDEQKVTWQRHQGPKSSWDISRRADYLRRT